MSESKSNRSVVVFGATGGGGSQLARELAAQGSRLFLTGRNEEKRRRLADELQTGCQPADATDSAQVRAVFAAALRHLESIDGVVSCVGSLLLKPATRTTDNEWFDTINTHLSSAFYVLREAAGALAARGGAIVLLSSAAARHGTALRTTRPLPPPKRASSASRFRPPTPMRDRRFASTVSPPA